LLLAKEKIYMKVKICGITNYEDAIHAIESGADALGFVFYDKSPRYITPQNVKEIIDRLPPFVEKVGLFVEEDAATIEHLAATSGITLAQLHWDVDEVFVDSVDFPTLPVVRAKRPEDISRFDGRYRLVDAFVAEYGGEGKKLALEWFEGHDNSQIVLAGGLEANNVAEVLRYGFYGVDVSSGVEAERGSKDSQKVERFIANAKSL
jgi:phosphoribosylanthranilate isomerase